MPIISLRKRYTYNNNKYNIKNIHQSELHIMGIEVLGLSPSKLNKIQFNIFVNDELLNQYYFKNLAFTELNSRIYNTSTGSSIYFLDPSTTTTLYSDNPNTKVDFEMLNMPFHCEIFVSGYVIF